MGLYFRKSFLAGPIRLNLSSGGIGASVGIPGFRFGISPKGRHYVRAGLKGVYLHHQFAGGRPRHQSDGPARDQSPPSPIPSEADDIYTTATAAEIGIGAQVELIKQLNEGYQRPPYDFIAFVALVGISLVITLAHLVLGGIALILSLVVTAFVVHHEHQKRVVVLDYHLTDDQRAAFTRFIDGFNTVAQCDRIWILNSARKIHDSHQRKLNAGAGTLLTRTMVRAGNQEPPWLKTNIPTPCLILPGTTLYFLPDLILIKDATGMGQISYADLHAQSGTSRFIEEEYPPSDSTVVDHTWKHPNKGGGPDKRFSHNPELPICLYGSVSLSTASQRHLAHLETSQTAAGEAMHAALERMTADLRTLTASAEREACAARVAAVQRPAPPKPLTTGSEPTVSVTAAEQSLADAVEREERMRLESFKHT